MLLITMHFQSSQNNTNNKSKQDIQFMNNVLSITKKICFMIGLTLLCPIQHATELVLQSVENVEEYKNHEGNYFKLIKIEQGCRIEVGFYNLLNQEFKIYIFKNNELISAKSKTYNYLYEKDYELSLDHVTDVIHYSTEYYNVKNNLVEQSLKEYKALFPTAYLNQCK